MKSADKRAQGHPIKVVSRRTGLSSDVLRVWEKRYGAVVPKRVSGRRLYSDDDLDRLMLLRRATLAGRPIGQVAKLTTAELEQLTKEDEVALLEAHASASLSPRQATTLELPSDASFHLTRAMEAVAALDANALQDTLLSASFELSQLRLIEELLVPLMYEIGSHWERGSLPIAHEHLASVVVRNFLVNLVKQTGIIMKGPGIIATTPSGHRHELGALVAAVAAAAEGWRPSFLGSDLPAAEIAAAVQSKQASAVALSIAYSENDAELASELIELRRLLPGTALLIGGASATAHRTTLKKIDAVQLRDLASLRAVLVTLSERKSVRTRSGL